MDSRAYNKAWTTYVSCYKQSGEKFKIKTSLLAQTQICSTLSHDKVIAEILNMSVVNSTFKPFLLCFLFFISISPTFLCFRFPLSLSLHQLLLLQSQSGESPHPPAQTETKGPIRLLNTAPFLHPSLHALLWWWRGFQEKTRPGLGLKSRTEPVKEREEGRGNGGWNGWGW